MIEFLLKSIGVSNEITTHLDQVQWGWTRPQYLWLLLPAALLSILVVAVHRRNLPHVAPLPRGILSGCRMAVLGLLVLVVAGPYVRLHQQEQRKPLLAFMIDESTSMTLPLGTFSDDRMMQLAQVAGMLETEDGSPDPAKLTPELRKAVNNMTRLQLVEQVLQHQNAQLFEPLAQQYDVRTYRVARRVRTAVLSTADDPLPAADLDATALGTAIDRVMDDAAGRTMSGLVLFTDGQSTTGPDPLAVIEQRAKRLAADQPPPCPVWVVPAGSATPLPDVTLLNLLAPAQVTLGDSITVIATIDSRGLDGEKVADRLIEGENVLDETELLLAGDRRQRAEFTFQADKAGARTLTVKIDAVSGEYVQDNNEQITTVEVGADQLKLLYLEGSPRWDFRFLDHALRRDNGLEVAIVMEAQFDAAAQEVDLPTLAKLPQDAEGFGAYHAIILGDISPAMLPQRLQQQLARAVADFGVGLIVQAGPMHMPHHFASGPVGDLLPLQFAADDGTSPQDKSGLQAQVFAPFHMKVTSTGAIHPAFRSYDSATKNRRLWSRMPPFHWAASADQARPGATVLATFDASDRSRPLIAEQLTGRGRVLVIGLDSLFLWRRNIGSHLFYRFWGQAIRHVARRKTNQADQNWMQVYPKRIEAGETVVVELHTIDAEGKPLEADQLTIQADWGDSRERVIVDRQDGAASLYRGTWQPGGTGAVELSYNDGGDVPVLATMQVTGSHQELLRPTVDRDALDMLADASGGAMIELDQIERLPTLVKGTPTMVARVLEEEIWDNWLMLVLLVGIYCIDVGVRRLQGLT